MPAYADRTAEIGREQTKVMQESEDKSRAAKRSRCLSADRPNISSATSDNARTATLQVQQRQAAVARSSLSTSEHHDGIEKIILRRHTGLFTIEPGHADLCKNTEARPHQFQIVTAVAERRSNASGTTKHHRSSADGSCPSLEPHGSGHDKMKQDVTVMTGTSGLAPCHRTTCTLAAPFVASKCQCRDADPEYARDAGLLRLALVDEALTVEQPRPGFTGPFGRVIFMVYGDDVLGWNTDLDSRYYPGQTIRNAGFPAAGSHQSPACRRNSGPDPHEQDQPASDAENKLKPDRVIMNHIRHGPTIRDADMAGNDRPPNHLEDQIHDVAGQPITQSASSTSRRGIAMLGLWHERWWIVLGNLNHHSIWCCNGLLTSGESSWIINLRTLNVGKVFYRNSANQT